MVLNDVIDSVINFRKIRRDRREIRENEFTPARRFHLISDHVSGMISLDGPPRYSSRRATSEVPPPSDAEMSMYYHILGRHENRLRDEGYHPKAIQQEFSEPYMKECSPPV